MRAVTEAIIGNCTHLRVSITCVDAYVVSIAADAVTAKGEKLFDIPVSAPYPLTLNKGDTMHVIVQEPMTVKVSNT